MRQFEGLSPKPEAHQFYGSSISSHQYRLRILPSPVPYTREGIDFQKCREESSHKKGTQSRMESGEMSRQESMRTIISERIRQSFMKDDELSDVTFIVGPGKVNVPGHKTILAFCSPVFQAQFYGPLSRVNEEGQGPTTVEIPDMEPETFIHFLSFLYRDELTDGNKGTVEDYLDLLYPANKYLVPALSRLCVQELRDKIDPENVFQVYETAVLYGKLELKNWCLKYMNKMSKKTIEMPQFLNLEPSMLSVFLESDGLAASEQEIHRAALRWAEAKVSRDGKKKSPESIRDALGDLIYLIRFPTMSEEEFRKEERVSVLRTEEIIEIYEQISSKDTSKQSRFGTKTRRLDCNLHLCRPNDYLKRPSVPVMYAYEPPCRRIRFKLRVDKRIFFKGVSLCSILNANYFKNASYKFQIELIVQVGDLPSVRTLSQVDGAVMEPNMKILRRRSPGAPRSCPIRAVVLDELAEVPANCVVFICVKVFRAGTPRMNLTHLDLMDVPLRQDVQVECLEDERTVAFKFFCSKDTEYVHRSPYIPDILFSL